MHRAPLVLQQAVLGGDPRAQDGDVGHHAHAPRPQDRPALVDGVQRDGGGQTAAPHRYEVGAVGGEAQGPRGALLHRQAGAGADRGGPGGPRDAEGAPPVGHELDVCDGSERGGHSWRVGGLGRTAALERKMGRSATEFQSFVDKKRFVLV